MTWHALHYPLRPGSETEVGELFRTSGRPRFDVTDDGGASAGRLLGTLAFVGAGTAVRVIEVEGSLPQVAGHMSRQPEVREFETALESHLAVPRDMRSPDGARAFFRRSALDAVTVRITEQGEPGDWAGMFYPLRPGHEDAVRELARSAADPGANGAGAAMVLVGGEKALRLVQVPAGAPRDAAHDPVDRAFRHRIAEHLAGGADPGSPPGGAVLTCVLSRRHDRDV